jgi:hypothetical protein
LEDYDRRIHGLIGDHTVNDATLTFKIGSNELKQALAEADHDGHHAPVEPEAKNPEIDDLDEETYSQFTYTEVILLKGDYWHIARVLGQKRDGDSNLLGRYHPNPLLDTSIHEVKFPDGNIQDYATNVIAEAQYTQVSG